MSIQFDTFDNVADRRELVILFQRLGGDLPDTQAQQVRASWLQKLACGVYVNPASCHPVGAYYLFVQIVGVLRVPIQEAAAKLDVYVKQKGWHET